MLQSPSLSHLAGTDEFGRDVLSRLIAGARLSLGVGVSAVLLGALAGTILGLISGFFWKMGRQNYYEGVRYFICIS
ncbi:hypothetical protein RWE15_03495 [Virgibacillus halophilus]|uniref:Uncharacterized protein n=1 Tax=Tigheibacillus halophilus TaxID=361280 RepID=A0ABU5C3A5_9BACI|nr:hypothetical protein [Virgibacillus halophilus]